MWYFDRMTGGDSSYLDLCALCALIDVFCHYESEKHWHEPQNYREFLRKLDPAFRKKLPVIIPTTRFKGGSLELVNLRDRADVFYTGVRCSLHHHGDLASYAGMDCTAELATELPNAVRQVGDTTEYPMIIFNPAKIKTSLRQWLDNYCDELLKKPNGYNAQSFKNKFQNDFGISIR